MILRDVGVAADGLTTLPPDVGGPQRTHVWVFDEVVVKVDFTAERNGVGREINALSLLEGTDLPVPRLVGNGALPDGRPWLVMSRVDGELPDDAGRPAHELSPVLAREMGAAAAQLHAAPGPPGFGNWTTQPKSIVELDLARTEVLIGMAERLDAVPLRERNALAADLASSRPVLATAPERAVLAHRDMQPRNVLVGPDGRLTGLIDFESAAGGDRVEDFRTIGLDWTSPGFAAFCAGYAASGGRLDRDAPARLAHYVLGWAMAIFAYLAPIAPAYLPAARTAVERVRSGELPTLPG